MEHESERVSEVEKGINRQAVITRESAAEMAGGMPAGGAEAAEAGVRPPARPTSSSTRTYLRADRPAGCAA